jgi:hypothetical protein
VTPLTKIATQPTNSIEPKEVSNSEVKKLLATKIFLLIDIVDEFDIPSLPPQKKLRQT